MNRREFIWSAASALTCLSLVFGDSIVDTSWVHDAIERSIDGTWKIGKIEWVDGKLMADIHFNKDLFLENFIKEIRLHADPQLAKEMIGVLQNESQRHL